MSLSIKDPETDHLARELARETGESITEAVARSVRERLDRVRARLRGLSRVEELDEIAQRCASLPELDRRSPEEILGYDDRGLPS